MDYATLLQECESLKHYREISWNPKVHLPLTAFSLALTCFPHSDCRLCSPACVAPSFPPTHDTRGLGSNTDHASRKRSIHPTQTPTFTYTFPTTSLATAHSSSLLLQQQTLSLLSNSLTEHNPVCLSSHHVCSVIILSLLT